MQLDSTRQIRDITPSREETDVVGQLNNLLLAGWKLIGFYVEAVSTQDGNFGKPHYVVAWQSSKAPPDEPLNELELEQEQERKKQLADMLARQLAESSIDGVDAEVLVGALRRGGSAAMALAMFLATQIAEVKG